MQARDAINYYKEYSFYKFEVLKTNFVVIF